MIHSKHLMVLLMATAMGFFVAGCNSKEKDEKNLPKASFDMEMENSKGQRVTMEAFKGKVIFLNVWATWCPPCIEEMPTIQNLYEEIGEEQVAFVMLSMDQDFQKAIEFRDKHNYQFEIYRPTGAIPAIYHTKLIPTTFIINSEGFLVLQHDGVGEFDTEAFQEFLAGVK